MDMAFEQKIRERAYEIWLAAGMADGMEVEHWCAAELSLKAKPAKTVAKTIKPKTFKATAKPAASKAKPSTAKAKKAPSKAATLN